MDKYQFKEKLVSLNLKEGEQIALVWDSGENPETTSHIVSAELLKWIATPFEKPRSWGMIPDISEDELMNYLDRQISLSESTNMGMASGKVAVEVYPISVKLSYNDEAFYLDEMSVHHVVSVEKI